MVDYALIEPGLQVVGMDGVHVGLVDRVEGDEIVLARDEAKPGRISARVPLADVEDVVDVVRLSRPAGDVAAGDPDVGQSPTTGAQS